MEQVEEYEDLWEDVEKVKDFHSRNYNHLISNFYLMKSALRYFSVRQGTSFTSSDISENFPLNAPIAGSCLTILEELNIIEDHNDSSSKSRYLARGVNITKMIHLEEILVERHEINSFS